MRKSDFLAGLTDVLSDGVFQGLWLLSIGIDNNPWGLYQPLILLSRIISVKSNVVLFAGNTDIIITDSNPSAFRYNID